ncbi:hypothetical protein chiPu_0014895 [Chiloscyllium punctatum]|uniref:Uncharacterized protein n=1 Tax=Chiloscyllium punctatum TaxID=137246 RepID=A0A401T196_CHIPU|nr:hypothetical protein [Chiloscyllium punctatum]
MIRIDSIRQPRVTNQDKVSAVFQKAMAELKFKLEHPEDFDLAQIIQPNKVLILANDMYLYYSMKKVINYDFILQDRYQYRP